MKRLLPFLSFFLISGWSCADQLKTVFNPFTGKPDYITALTTNSIVAGSNVTTSCTNGACTINSSGGGVGSANYYVYSGSSTVANTITSTAFTCMVGSTFTIALHNASNSWSISTSGTLYIQGGGGVDISILRDSQNLGSTYGFARLASQSDNPDIPASISFIDTPGDTNAHSYCIATRSEGGSTSIYSDNSTLTFNFVEVGTASGGGGGGGGSSGSFILNASGNPPISSTATLLAGTNVTLSQSGSTITINSTSVGGGVLVPSTFTWPSITVSTIQAVSSMTVQNITINGTCTGAGCGTSGSSTAINPSTSSILIPSPYTLTSMVSSSSPLVFVSSNTFTNVEGDPAITQCTQIGGTGLLSNSCNVNDPGPLATIANFVYMGYALASNHSSYGQYIDNNQNTSGGGNTFGAFNYAANGQGENIGVEGWGGDASGLTAVNYGGYFLAIAPHSGAQAYGIYSQERSSSLATTTSYAGYFDAYTYGWNTDVGVYTAGAADALELGSGDMSLNGSSGNPGQCLISEGSKNLPQWSPGFNIYASSAVASGSGGLAVTYNVNVGSMTGAGLTSCSGASNAVTWNSSTDEFGCNTISSSGGGASALAVALGGVGGFTTLLSSPTPAVIFDSNTFTGSLNGGGTTYLALTSSVTKQGVITAAGLGALTANQTITLSNNATGSGTTAIAVNAQNISLSSQVVGNLPVTNLNSGTNADSSHFWRGDGTWVSSSSFLTGNQSITLSGDSTGSGATAITVTAAATQPNIAILSHAITATSSVTVTGAGGVGITYGVTAGSVSVNALLISTTAITGNFTLTSTTTVVMANCASACTMTLPTAVGISGEIFNIKMIGAGAVSINTTSAQTIDGSTTITPSPNQWANIEVISDGSNWSIL